MADAQLNNLGDMHVHVTHSLKVYGLPCPGRIDQLRFDHEALKAGLVPNHEPECFFLDRGNKRIVPFPFKWLHEVVKVLTIGKGIFVDLTFEMRAHIGGKPGQQHMYMRNHLVEVTVLGRSHSNEEAASADGEQLSPAKKCHATYFDEDDEAAIFYLDGTLTCPKYTLNDVPTILNVATQCSAFDKWVMITDTLKFLLVNYGGTDTI
ncbi:hypothetical protein JCM5296_001278 [Sporobolomyces johnsonii]